MNKYKYLLKNVGLLTISNFGTKILSFLLIPLYTSILSTADYGTFDIYSTTVSLLVPILTLNIVEAVMRFTLDPDYPPIEVLSVGIRGIAIAICGFTVINVINSVFRIVPVFTEYALYFELLFCGSLIYNLFIQFARGIEKVADVAIAGAINSVVMIGCNVLFLVALKWGLSGYFAAYCLSYAVPLLYLFIRLKIWKFVSIRNVPSVRHEMYSYSRPLVFNTIAWWINNVSDRYIVTWFCGMAVNGVYSVAYKIPSVLNIVQSIFSQAWTLSAVKEYEKNSEQFYAIIYKVYNCGMVIVCSGLILMDKVMARILFAKEFYVAWQYAPYLMISVVFGSLSGMLGGIFSAAKKSGIFAKTTIIGAVINTILNIVLVWKMGAIGAAISTMVSYCIVWVARFIEAQKIVKFSCELKRDIATYFLLLIQATLWLVINQDWIVYLIETALFIVIVCLYLKDVLFILRKLKHSRR